MPTPPLRIATRASELALRQARMVQAALAARDLPSELATYTTVGDRRLDQPLSAIGAKGLFTEELERDLLAGRVDCCVHSLKDLPTSSPAGLEIVAVLPREDPRDVLVLGPALAAGPGKGIAALPAGTRVGTSSLRRRAQLLALRPDLQVVDLRGNVPTRLRKVQEGQVDAAILAAAGLHRLDMAHEASAYLEPPEWLPAAGQGAIAVQIRADDAAARACFTLLNHEPTMFAVRAERTLLGALEGGCQVPIGALVVERDGLHTLHGLVADLAGRQVVTGARQVDLVYPEQTGEELARELLDRGGDAILAALRGARDLPSPQPE